MSNGMAPWRTTSAVKERSSVEQMLVSTHIDSNCSSGTSPSRTNETMRGISPLRTTSWICGSADVVASSAMIERVHSRLTARSMYSSNCDSFGVEPEDVAFAFIALLCRFCKICSRLFLRNDNAESSRCRRALYVSRPA